MPEHAPDGVLAVDLDGTVVGVNTFPSFVRFLTRELWRTRRVGALTSLVAAGVLRKAHLAGHGDLKRRVCLLGETLPDDRVHGWAQRVLDEHGHPGVVAVVRGWDGPTVLTTAAPQVYADHLGRLLGVDEVHGSTVDGRTLVNNESAQKVVRLRATGVPRVALFLTDDLVIDAPMAALADRVLVVDATGALHEIEAGQPS